MGYDLVGGHGNEQGNDDDENVESRGWGRDCSVKRPMPFSFMTEARAGSKRDFYGKETQSSKKAGEDDMLVIGRRYFLYFFADLDYHLYSMLSPW